MNISGAYWPNGFQEAPRDTKPWEIAHEPWEIAHEPWEIVPKLRNPDQPRSGLQCFEARLKGSGSGLRGIASKTSKPGTVLGLGFKVLRQVWSPAPKVWSPDQNSPEWVPKAEGPVLRYRVFAGLGRKGVWASGF